MFIPFQLEPIRRRVKGSLGGVRAGVFGATLHPPSPLLIGMPTHIVRERKKKGLRDHKDDDRWRVDVLEKEAGERNHGERRVDIAEVTQQRIRVRLKTEGADVWIYIIFLKLPATSVNCYQLALSLMWPLGIGMLPMHYKWSPLT